MSRPAVGWSLLLLVLAILFSLHLLAQTAPRPLRASEVMAVQAGGALEANIAHDITTRGLNFHPTDEFLLLMKKAGADETVLKALKTAKLDPSPEAKPNQQLLQQLSDATVLMKEKKYSDATTILSDALDKSFARLETGYVMAELLRQQEKFGVALSVYQEILETEPDFPEVHVKASFLLYRLQDANDALNEAKAALAENLNDAEAHKNEGLALEDAQKFDAAIAEFKEALRIKPDYAVVHYDLGLLYFDMHSYDDSIAEYKKAIVLDPNNSDAHNNLGNAYKSKGDAASAVLEFREAKRLNPNDPFPRQNLASMLMQQSPSLAIQELQELETKFPNFEVCRICLGRALAWQGDTKAAEAEFRKANDLDPADPNGHRGLGSIQEQQKNYDAALEEYRSAEKIAPGDSNTHQDIGRVLLARKDYGAAVEELKQAEALSQTSWEIHDLLGQALLANAQIDLAVGEFKEAIALDSTQARVMMELGGALEKKGDWVSALEQYRNASLTDAAVLMKAQPGQSVLHCGTECTQQYTAAQGRFADYLVSLRSSGHGAEATDLEKRVAQLDAAAGTKEKVEMTIKTGDQAYQERKMEDAEKSYKQAVDLARNLPPGDENLILALGRLGNAYAMQQKFTDAGAAFHEQLAVVEKAFGPGSDQSVEPLRYLGRLAAVQKNYKEAEAYLQRALDINLKMTGDNNPRAVEGLRDMAGFYETQSDWPKAETYLLRAVKGAEAAQPDLVLIPLWGLCDLYDRWGKPEQSQPCWHRATGIIETQFGHDSPRLSDSLNNEARALRQLGHKDEAESLEQRLAKIRQTAQN
jgi:tetratricopeptide (TPR) repeat protein